MEPFSAFLTLYHLSLVVRRSTDAIEFHWLTPALGKHLGSTQWLGLHSSRLSDRSGETHRHRSRRLLRYYFFSCFRSLLLAFLWSLLLLLFHGLVLFSIEEIAVLLRFALSALDRVILGKVLITLWTTLREFTLLFIIGLEVLKQSNLLFGQFNLLF